MNLKCLMIMIGGALISSNVALADECGVGQREDLPACVNDTVYTGGSYYLRSQCDKTIRVKVDIKNDKDHTFNLAPKEVKTGSGNVRSVHCCPNYHDGCDRKYWYEVIQ